MPARARTQRVGLISDTHGLLRPQALEVLRGCSHIIHAGDIGDAQILRELRALAPLTVVRGNNDRDEAYAALPDAMTIELGDVRIHVLHDLKQLAIDPAAAGVDVVIAGHTHQPRLERREGVLYVNPGSAGRRRFKLPIALGELLVDGSAVQARIIELTDTVRGKSGSRRTLPSA